MATLLLKTQPAAGASAGRHQKLVRGGALAVILACAWYLRAIDPNYSTAFMDEAAYVLYGRMFLSGVYEGPLAHHMQWTFGWYVWPVMATLADRVAGMAGVREWAAFLGVLTTLAVYGFGRRLFSPAVGLGAAAGFAVLAPAVFNCRIATRDAGMLPFFMCGLWLFAWAWQENDRRIWLTSAAAFFGAFLCKYTASIFFPPLVLLALSKGWQRRAYFAQGEWRPRTYFVLPLTLACIVYGLYYREDLIALLTYANQFQSLKALPGDAVKVYVTQRIDFYILLPLALLGCLRAERRKRALSWLLLGGAAIMPAFHAFSRADYDYWKDVNYSMIFLLPLAAQGLLGLIPRGRRGWTAIRVAAVALLAAALAWAGQSWNIQPKLMWPNVEPVIAFFQGRLQPHQRVLVDDQSLRYYLAPPLTESEITDPFSFTYQDKEGQAAYAAAVRDGYFDYVVLDSGGSPEGRLLDETLKPELDAHYTLQLRTQERVLHEWVRIYERRPATGAPAGAPAETGQAK